MYLFRLVAEINYYIEAKFLIYGHIGAIVKVNWLSQVQQYSGSIVARFMVTIVIL